MRWMQAVDQVSDDRGASGGEWGWTRARTLHYLALTTADPVAREAATADLFRALGQIMHLVVDASVPEHTRNDPHPFGTLTREVLQSRTAGNYEYWVSDRQARLGDVAFTAQYLSTPIGPQTDIAGMLPPPDEPVARIPVARLVDADRYRPESPDPNVTLTAPIGIAEFANANFFSEDTLFGADPQGGRLPFPRREQLRRRTDIAPLNTRIRAYYEKRPGHGLVTSFALAECVLDGRAPAAPPYPCVDEAVWDETAAHMLPRAVGYARAVLDYFFRGSIAVTSVTWNASGIVVEIQNTGAEEMEGVFELWARHHPDTPRERRQRLAVLGSEPPTRLDPGELRTFDGILAPPDAVATAKHLLVFRGRLGLEQEAVVGRVVTVPHVEIRQQTYHAETVRVCSAPSVTSASLPLPKTTVGLRGESLTCGWRIAAHRITGTLATNMPTDPEAQRSEPIIRRIEARWSGDTTPAPLRLDGRPVAGVWQRQGAEPDPTTFEIVHRTEQSPFSDLYLLVSYADERNVATRIARFATAAMTHDKAMVIDNRVPEAPRYLVTSRRSATGFLWYDWGAQFDAISHNGAAVPTFALAPRRFGNADVATEGVFASEFIYFESAIDDFDEFVDGRSADTFFNAIALQSPHPSGPSYRWIAELRRRYHPMEQAFRRAFVTADVAPFQVRLTGEESAATGTQ